MFSTALIFRVITQSGSILALSTLLSVEVGPMLFGSVLGILVDRWDRKRLAIATDGLRALVVLIIWVVNIKQEMWIIDAVMGTESLLTVLAHPTRASILSSLLHNDERPRGNSLVQSGLNLARMLGPAFGAWLLIKVGLHPVVILDSLTYLVSLWCLTRMRIPDRAGPSRLESRPLRPLWLDWTEGFKAVIESSQLLRVRLSLILILTADGILSPGLVTFISRGLHENAAWYGAMQSIGAVAAIVAGLVLARFAKRLAPNLLLPLALGGHGILYIVIFGWIRSPWAVLLLYGLGAASGALWISSLSTVLQANIPKAIQGRVFGSLGSIQALALLLGINLAPSLVKALGLATALAGTGVLTMIAAMILLTARSSGKATDVVISGTP